MADEVLKMVFLTLVAAGMVIAITRRDWLGFAAVCLLVAAGGR